MKPKGSDDQRNIANVLLGAAFLMATSAIGPGFLTQTALFTEQLRANFAFVILTSVILSLGAQLNIWRVISMSGLRGQDIANKVLPGLGYVVAFLVALGGLAFNIGNVGGAALGLNVLFGLDLKLGAIISAVIAFGIFSSKEIGRTMDSFTKYLGLLMIALTLYVSAVTKPPVGEAVVRMVAPTEVSLLSIITLVGGTVGGYISFSGGHRLLDAGIMGSDNLEKVNRSAINGMAIAGIMRVLLFLAVLGVVSTGASLDPANPPASAFQIGAGMLGYKFFGVVLWSAAITSVVGASYTSVSFLRTLFDTIERNVPKWIMGFIAASTLLFVTVGRPVTLLVLAGSLNGLILPLTLGTILFASKRKDIVGDYEHPAWLLIFGIIIVAVTLYMGITSLKGMAALWQK
ncbi:MAG: NRAMP family divalent metal transporter [bacterium]|jgi:Mn2+/Fe2+ NRAMP family transporter|nr:divalent metal cation transporter [Bacillota bacterium]